MWPRVYQPFWSYSLYPPTFRFFCLFSPFVPCSGPVQREPLTPQLRQVPHRNGNEERRKFYFGNLDPYRMVANSDFMVPFQTKKQHWRADPYDNQVGEMETSDHGLTYSEFIRTKEVISCEMV